MVITLETTASKSIVALVEWIIIIIAVRQGLWERRYNNDKNSNISCLLKFQPRQRSFLVTCQITWNFSPRKNDIPPSLDLSFIFGGIMNYEVAPLNYDDLHFDLEILPFRQTSNPPPALYCLMTVHVRLDVRSRWNQLLSFKRLQSRRIYERVSSPAPPYLSTQGVCWLSVLGKLHLKLASLIINKILTILVRWTLRQHLLDLQTYEDEPLWRKKRISQHSVR